MAAQERNTFGKSSFRSCFPKKNSLVTFDELKDKLVDSKIMNLATLYRTIDSFESQWALHELQIGDKRVYALCSSGSKATKHCHIELSYCHCCSHFEDKHTEESEHILSRTTVTHFAYCQRCGMQGNLFNIHTGKINQLWSQ